MIERAVINAGSSSTPGEAQTGQVKAEGGGFGDRINTESRLTGVVSELRISV